MTDTTISSAADVELLKYNGSAWVNSVATGYIKQVYDSGWISIPMNSWNTVTHNITWPYFVKMFGKVANPLNGSYDSEYAVGDIFEITPNDSPGAYQNMGVSVISKDNTLRVNYDQYMRAISSSGNSDGYITADTTQRRIILLKQYIHY